MRSLESKIKSKFNIAITLILMASLLKCRFVDHDEFTVVLIVLITHYLSLVINHIIYKEKEDK